jgi:UDP-glucose 4-epimerase
MGEHTIEKKNVFITGVSGYIGQRIVERFSSREDIGEIIGIDIFDPPCYRNRMTFIKHNVRDDMISVMSRYHIDWAIHAAYVISVIHDTHLIDEIDLQGTNNFHKACGQLGIKNVLQVSSSSAYGGHKDNPALLTEDLPLRGNDDFPYGKNKAIIENTTVKEFREKHPDVNYTVVRPCFVCGPHFYKNPLGRHLMKKIVMLPNDAKPYQFVHEDDVADSMYFLLSNNMHGVFNLAGDGAMTFKEMVAMTRGIYLPLPPLLLNPACDLAWKMRMSFLTEFPSAPMALLTNPFLISNKKIKDAGYMFRYTTRETYETFAEQVRNFYGRGRNRAI